LEITEKSSQVHLPFLIVHSRDDGVTSPAGSELLHAQVSGWLVEL
jgi:hypothetical protein